MTGSTLYGYPWAALAPSTLRTPAIAHQAHRSHLAPVERVARCRTFLANTGEARATTEKVSRRAHRVRSSSTSCPSCPCARPLRPPGTSASICTVRLDRLLSVRREVYGTGRAHPDRLSARPRGHAGRCVRPGVECRRSLTPFRGLNSTRAGGLGIGLFEVGRAVALLGHRVEVRSAVGYGSRFSVFARAAR
jgi:hypothetical protein